MMKRFNTLLGLLFVAAATIQAAPFLVCDPYPNTGPQPTSFTITGLGGTTPSSAAVTATTNPDGSVQLHYDLASLAAGKYTVTLTAVNAWGASAASGPFVFTSGAPGTPSNTRISSN